MDLENHVVQGCVNHQGGSPSLYLAPIPVHVSADVVAGLHLFQKGAQGGCATVIPLPAFIQKASRRSMGQQQVNGPGGLTVEGEQLLQMGRGQRPAPATGGSPGHSQNL